MIVYIIYTIDFKMVEIIVYQTKCRQYGIKTEFIDQKWKFKCIDDKIVFKEIIGLII